MTAAADPRAADRAPRRAVDLGGTMRDAAWRPIEVQVADLSATGFSMRTAEPLAAGDVITVAIGGLGPRSAIVVRTTADGVACRFRDALPDDLARAAEALASDTVALLPFGARVDLATPPEPEHRLPARARIGTMLAGALALWAIVWAASRALH